MMYDVLDRTRSERGVFCTFSFLAQDYSSLPPHPHPFGAGASKQPSQEFCSVSHGLQHVSHTLHPVMGLSQTIVLLRWPQLCGVMHLQPAMHSPGDCEPCTSCTHFPVVELQLHMIGAGAGVGTGAGTGVGTGNGALQVVMHGPGASEPCGSSEHRPVVLSQLYMVGLGVGRTHNTSDSAERCHTHQCRLHTAPASGTS